MCRPLAVLVVAAALIGVSPAGAHSLLLESSPPAGSVVTGTPPRVSLRFNNRIETKLSRLRLVDSRGGARELAVTGIDGAPDRLTAGVPSLGAGGYRVEWQVLSTDGHIVSGRFSFRVSP